MSDTPQTPQRDFSAIQADLEKITRELSDCSDPQVRKELLRKMRTLIQEATDAANSL